MSRTVELFADGFGFVECPRWRDDRLWFADMVCHQVKSVGLAGDVQVELTLDDWPGGLGWLPDGRLLVVSMQRRVVLRHQPDGTLVVHADLSSIANGDLNELVVGDHGTAYVGHVGYDWRAGAAPRAANLLVVQPDGQVSVGATDLLHPNGSVITPPGDRLVVSESMRGRLLAFRIAPDGALGERTVWANLGERHPDGCTLDTDGAIWIANPRGGDVARVLEGGEVTDVIRVPETPYACTLGGAEGRTMYVLTSPSFPSDDLPSGNAKIWSTEVEVPGAGQP